MSILEYSERVNNRIKPLDYFKLIFPDKDDIIATIGVIISVALVKQYLFQVHIAEVTLFGLYSFLNDGPSKILLALFFLGYWAWRWGYISAHHYMEIQKKNLIKIEQNPDAFHYNINFYGLILALILFFI